MPPIVIDLKKTDDRRDVVHRAVQTLTEGQLVVFPTETVYGVGACARKPAGIDKIFAAKGRHPEAPLALAIKSAEEALDYVPGLGRVAERLARRCWPGPVTLVVDLPQREAHAADEGLLGQLPEMVQRAVAPNGTLGLRVPAHDTVLDTLRMLAGPIALTSANLSGQPAAVTAKEAVDSLGDQVALVLDDGPCRYGQPSSVVQTTGSKCRCIREGVVSQSTLDRLSSMVVLIVCTGNTCRSPMAEVVMRHLVAKKMQWPNNQLEQHGIIIASAGIAALSDCAPSSEAVEVMQERGMDLSKHESQPLTDKLVRHADIILTLTGGHRNALTRRWPECAERTHTLRGDGGDINDPIGGSLTVYRACADQITSALQERIAEIDFS
ncbi:MAG: threonylcarbamoyl-AMP synthase [Pirellulales bacterium]|nr:threonylcarbamoyl-AMP synthase [Pirellulales bacterium]